VFEGSQDEVEGWLAGAQPSPTSMRASPDYREAMLRVLAHRAIQAAQMQLGS